MSIFDKAGRERVVDFLEDYFDEQSDWLAGQYRGYLDGGLPARRALRRTRRDFFRLVAEEMDSRAEWDRVKRDEVRQVLESIDGFVFEALLQGLLNIATARILGTGTGLAGLLAVADDAIGAAREALAEPEPELPSERPTVIGRPREVAPKAPIPDWMPRLDEDVEETGAAVDGGSAAAVKDRLTDMLATDRAILGDPRADDLLGGEDYAPDPDTDDDDEEEPLRRRLPSLPTGRLFGLGGVLSSFRSGGDE